MLSAQSGEVVEEVLVGVKHAVKDLGGGEHSQVEGAAARGSGLATQACCGGRCLGRPEPHGAAVDRCLAVNGVLQDRFKRDAKCSTWPAAALAWHRLERVRTPPSAADGSV